MLAWVVYYTWNPNQLKSVNHIFWEGGKKLRTICSKAADFFMKFAPYKAIPNLALTSRNWAHFLYILLCLDKEKVLRIIYISLSSRNTSSNLYSHERATKQLRFVNPLGIFELGSRYNVQGQIRISPLVMAKKKFENLDEWSEIVKYSPANKMNFIVRDADMKVCCGVETLFTRTFKGRGTFNLF